MAIYYPDALLGTAIGLPALAIIVLCLRFYVRLHVRRTYIGVDDWLVLLSVILVCGQGVLQVLSVVYGVGGQDDGPPEARNKGALAYQARLIKVIVVMEKFTYTFIKLSVLFLYRRIFGANRTFRKITDVLIVLIIMWGILFVVLESVICVASRHWSTECTAQEWTLLWFGITEVIGDILILSLPYPMIRRLHISKREKVGLAATFALGTLSTVTGAVRLGYVSKTFYGYFHPDFVNNTGSAPAFWTTVEVSTGVVAACLPPLRPLLTPVPKKAIHSLQKHLLSTRSPDTQPDSTTQGANGTDGFTDEKSVVTRSRSQQNLKSGQAEAHMACLPPLPLTLSDSSRFSQHIPAQFLEDVDSSPSTVSNKGAVSQNTRTDSRGDSHDVHGRILEKAQTAQSLF